MFDTGGRARTAAMTATAVLACGAGTAVAVAAPSFAPSPASTRTSQSDTDANFTAVAAAPRKSDETTGSVAVASFRTISGTDTARALVLQGGSRGSDDIFKSATELLAGPGRAKDIAYGDVDGDGRRDIALTLNNSTTQIRLDKASGFVTAPAVSGTGATQQLADVNGDGRADLVSADYQAVAVRLSLGDGTFGAPTTVGVSSSGVPAIAAADLDGDGRADVLAGDGPTAQLFLGKATGPAIGTPTTVTIAGRGTTVRNFAVSDLDREGNNDIVALLGDQRISTVLHATLNGPFAAPVISASPVGPTGLGSTAVALADLDGDDHADLVTSGSDGEVRLSVYTTAARFAAPIDLAAAGSGAAVAIAELTADGRADIAYVNRAPYVQELRVLRNTTPFPPRTQKLATVDEVGADEAVVRGVVATTVPGADVKVNYRVAGSPDAVDSETQPVGLTEPGFATRHRITGLKPSTNYEVRVVATNEAGSSQSDVVRFRTLDAPVVPPAPPVPPADTALSAAVLSESTRDPTHRTIENADTFFRVNVAGSAGPWTIRVDWGANEGAPTDVSGPTGGYDLFHDFHAAPPLDPKILPRGGARKAYRTVTVTATDRVGRPTTTSQLVTVLPDVAPTAAFASDRAILEYGARNAVVSLSRDADTPEDEIAREQWDLDSDGVDDVDRRLPAVSPCLQLRPPAITAACAGAGKASTLFVTPWEQWLAKLGKGPLESFKLPEKVGFPVADTPLNLRARQADALRGAAAELCEFCKGGALSRKLSLTVTDRSGRTDLARTTLPVRTPQPPRAEASVKIGNGKEPAIKADDPAGSQNGTPIVLDASRSSADDSREPVWYVLEVGTPWQAAATAGGGRCFEKGDVIKQRPGIALPTQQELDPGFGVFPGPDFAGEAKVTNPAVAAIRAARSSVQVNSSTIKRYDGACKSSPKKADFGVNDRVAVVVSRTPENLAVTIPRAGVGYSLLLTVFDRYGQVDKVRYDGFKAIASEAQCAARDYTIGAVNVAGGCISYKPDPAHSRREIAWTTGSILVNGLELAPQKGASWIIDSRDDGTPRLYAATGSPLFEKPGGAWALHGYTRAAADLLVGGSPAARIVPASGDACAGGPGPGNSTPEAKKATRFCVDAPDAAPVAPLEGAQYQGLKIPKALTLRTDPLSDGVGRSHLGFVVELPRGFGDANANGDPVGAPPTAQTDLDGSVTSAGIVISTNRLRAVRGRSAHARRAVARAAGAGRDGRIMVDSGTLLAGFGLASPLRIDIDAATGSGTGEATLDLSGMTANITVVVTAGQLTAVRGEVPFTVPAAVGGTFYATRLKFGITVQPKVQITGSLDLESDFAGTPPVLGLAKIVGTVTLEPKPFKLTIDGDVQLASFSLAQAHVSISGSQFAASARIGASFGPASVNGTVAVDVGSYGFNAFGSVEGCFIVCSSFEGLISSKGIAVCHEVDLLFASINVGAGLEYAKLPFIRPYLAGCTTTPYRATPTSRAVLDRPDLGGDLGAGGVAVPQGSPVSFPVGPGLKTLTVVATSLGGQGSAPRLTLTEPGGRTFTTPSQLEDFASATTAALVEADPESGTTRFVIDAPKPGRWMASIDAGSPPITSLELGRDTPALTAKLFDDTEVRTTSTVDAAATVKQGKLQGIGLFGTAPKSATKRRAIVRAAARAKRKPKAKLAPLAKIRGGAAIGSSEVDTADLRRVVALGVDVTLTPGDLVTFSERAPGVQQQLGSYAVPADGRLRAKLVFDPARAPASRRSIDAFVTDPDGVPRGRVADVTSFRADPIVAKRPPKLLRVERRGRTRTLVFAKATSYRTGDVPELKLTARGSLGTSLTRMISGADLKRGRRGTYRYTLHNIAPTEDLRGIRIAGLDAMGRSSQRSARHARSMGGALAGTAKARAAAKRARRRRA